MRKYFKNYINMSMIRIRFSYNWNNKLNSNAFSTIRLPSRKYETGKEYEIVDENNTVVCHAILIEIKEFRLGRLTEGMARLDTGYSKQEAIDIINKMYKSIFPPDPNNIYAWLLLQVTDRKIFLPNNKGMRNNGTELFEQAPALLQSKDAGMGPSNSCGV